MQTGPSSQPSTVKNVSFAIVTPNEDVCLQCATSLLRLQQTAARKPDIHLDIHFVSSFLDALNVVSVEDNKWLIIVDASCGIPDQFVYHAIESGKDMVLGVYPLARVDWNRVSTRLNCDETDTEPLAHAGNVYNVTPKSAAYNRYVTVADAEETKIMCVSTAALRKISGPHTSFVQPNSGHLFTHDSVNVKDGISQRSNVYQTIVRKFLDHGLSVVADIENQCTNSGNAQFAGCVGLRGFVR